jgi:putative transposase
MKKSKFSDAQIFNILKQAETSTPVPELCWEHDMSSAAFYEWRAKYGGIDAIADGPTQGIGRRKPAAEEDAC